MIYVGADHGGFELKGVVKRWLADQGYAFEDLGNTVFDKEDDYPQYALAVATNVSTQVAVRSEQSNVDWKNQARGILACRSAAGVVIAANKVKGIRAVAVTNAEMTKHAREHNDANVIALSGDWTSEEEVKKIVDTFLTTEFSHEERHARRLAQIAVYEEDYCVPPEDPMPYHVE